VRPHRGAGARLGHLDRRVGLAETGPRFEKESAVAVNRRVAIIGSGLIGRSWAVVFAGGGFDVALYDPAPGVADQARGLVSEGLEELSAHGLVKDATDAARVRAATSLADALDGAGHVQESSPETLEEKRAIFAELDRLAGRGASLPSCTATIGPR